MKYTQNVVKYTLLECGKIHTECDEIHNAECDKIHTECGEIHTAKCGKIHAAERGKIHTECGDMHTAECGNIYTAIVTTMAGNVKRNTYCCGHQNDCSLMTGVYT